MRNTGEKRAAHGHRRLSHGSCGIARTRRARVRTARPRGRDRGTLAPSVKDETLLNSQMRRVGVMASFVAAVTAALIGGMAGPERASVDFFAVAAQVLPVLVLALTVESSVFRYAAALEMAPEPPAGAIAASEWKRLTGGPIKRRIYAVLRWARNLPPWWATASMVLVGVLVLAVLMVGEVTSLDVVATGHQRVATPNRGSSAQTVYATILFGFTLVTGLAAAGAASAVAEGRSSAPEGRGGAS